MPKTGENFLKYGGNTSCIFLRMGGQNILLDAGSGLLNFERELLQGDNKLHLLFSHTHMDHLMGLPFADIMFDDTLNIDIYGESRSGLDIKEQISRLVSPPLWPISFDDFCANVRCYPLKSEFFLGDVRVRTMHANHPGGCCIIRLDCEDKSVVYATDNEMAAAPSEEFIRFTKGCTLLVCDGQYSKEEYPQKRGFGHTGRNVALKAAAQTECEQFIIFHHDPLSTDDILDAVQRKISNSNPQCFLAKEGMEISL